MVFVTVTFRYSAMTRARAHRFWIAPMTMIIGYLIFANIFREYV